MQLKRFYVTGVARRGSKRWWDQANDTITSAPENMRSFVASRGDEWCNITEEELYPFYDWANTIPRKDGVEPPVTVIDRESEAWAADAKFAQSVDAFTLDWQINQHREVSSQALHAVGVEIEIYPDNETEEWIASVGPFGNGQTIDGRGPTAHDALFALYDALKPADR